MFEYLVTVYFVFAFVKFMLCLPHVPLVVATLSRLSGGGRGSMKARYAVSIPLILVALSILGWVLALRREGVSFFVMYPARSVMRDCVGAYREAHADTQQ